jgi:hypothetical protein
LDKTYNLNGAFKPTAKRSADLDGPDFYPTPAWATHALLDNESFEGNVWECACGNGAMSQIIGAAGYDVYSSDLYDRGYGEAGVDFLEAQKEFDNIITNPPFNSAEGFAKTGLKLARNKFALLLRLAFLEGANRANTLFADNPPARVWVFSERITFYPAGAVQQGSGTTAYAWFVWDKSSDGPTELKWFRPGYKKAFPKQSDQAGLFD